MEIRGLLFLLLSGCVSLCHLQTEGITRRFHVVNQNMTWLNAQSYCRGTFSDLATIQDRASNAAAQQVAGNGDFWIGLYNISWRWSEGNEDIPTYNGFTNWAPSEPRPGSCVVISELGIWSVKNCGSRYSFVCYNAAAKSHILVNWMVMTWTDAQTFCRSKYSDLSTIKTKEDNVKVSGLLQSDPGPTVAGATTEGQNTSTYPTEGAPAPVAWIGLFRNVWGWSDRSSTTYWQWVKDVPGGNCNCVIMRSSPLSGDWFQKPCDEKHSFLCYTAVTSSVRTSVKVRFSVGSADMKDLALQDSILRQLNLKLQDGDIREEVKLRWVNQPNGKVFHTDEEERGTPHQCDPI
ncbi:Macrophage mannose receptor 1 [Channa argus]|uniref:Macrophage mannose receptor 1 n=1 Tax=Channa argus TaxID=215402 RepID=A0A6G1PR54_CHAAH|nr:Macrophage mannose receptor 1 [Channa argus]